ncbi:MAG: hypothetical protein JNL42_23480 [Anaerolineae bacterium]|nr:hypothetical protein [Anaerolineae bacterium]
MTLEAILQEIRGLPIRERKRLITLIIDTLPDELDSPAKRSISELRGLGKEIWEGVDAQTYVDELRSEWNHRP